jgi:hypothetical protein
MDLAGSTQGLFGVIRRGPCKDLPTWTLFGGALAVTWAIVDIMAKSMQRPREVHFSFQKNGRFCFPAGELCDNLNPDSLSSGSSLSVQI